MVTVTGICPPIGGLFLGSYFFLKLLVEDF